MEPQIQYTRTSDGVSIAYMTIGAGPPMLYCPTQFLDMRHLMNQASDDKWHGLAMAGRTRFTIFDHGGIGASQRDVSDFSRAAQVRAIEAVAAQLPDEQFTLVGFGAGSASAALYAARHPERVRELVCLFPTPSVVSERFAAMLGDDWSLARRRLAGWAYPDSLSHQRWFSNAMRESMSAEVAAAYMMEFVHADLKEIFARIPVRTLFCVAPAGQDRDDALALASVVRDCRVAVAVYPSDEVSTSVLEFMGADASGVGAPAPRGTDGHGTAIILFADIVDSTALTERLGDAAFRAKSRDVDVELRRIIAEAGGTTIDAKTLGDGVLATFSAASQAIDAALRFERAADGAQLQLHVGIHAGDVIREEGNVFGGAVNIAARISALSEPGEVLVSATVRELARTSAGVEFEDRGEQQMKGVGEPVRVYAVRGS